MYLKDRENAELLGMTHPQYMAMKYQAESLIHATGDESDHSYGNLYDPSEYLKDYCALAMHRETRDEDLMLRSSKDYTKIVKNLADIQFSGRFSPYLMNEPLMDKNTFKVMEYVLDNPNKDLELSITTNMCPVNQALFERFMTLIKQLDVQ